MSETINILLVEDEPDLVLIIRNTLTSQGFNVRTAMDGEEGLRKFYAEKPDVLVADVMMPKMDGFTMVRQIRQTDQQTPVLFLTARSAIDDVVEGFELGANDYLKKPFGMMELIVRLRSLAEEGRFRLFLLPRHTGLVNSHSIPTPSVSITPAHPKNSRHAKQRSSNFSVQAKERPSTQDLSFWKSGATMTSSTPAAFRYSSLNSVAVSNPTHASAS